MKGKSLNKGKLIKAELYSRPNAKKYRAAQLGLDDLSKVKDSDIFFLETLQMKANLADKTGLKPSAISHFERGRRLPSLKNLVKLADALGVTLDELVRWF